MVKDITKISAAGLANMAHIKGLGKARSQKSIVLIVVPVRRQLNQSEFHLPTQSGWEKQLC